MRLPDKFIAETDEFFERHPEITKEGFYESFDEEPLKAVRFSGSKTSEEDREKILGLLGQSKEKVPFCDSGYYVDADFANDNPFYHAGVYYPQEPSAMLPGRVIAAKPGEFILDMCAAPGGKACRVGEDLSGDGLLVANEINFKRSKALLRNIERSGISNSVILNETPQNIAAKLPGFFDKILIDAPCSGEGMFRRDPGAVKSYETYGPESISAVQKEILHYADICLRDGGEIVYSTCTFCELEDEEMIAGFIGEHPEYKVISHPEINGVTHAGDSSQVPCSMRIWPHINGGDGHFCVHLVKGENKPAPVRNYTEFPRQSKASERNALKCCDEFLKDILNDEGMNFVGKMHLVLHGNSVFGMSVPDSVFAGLKVCKTGLYIGDYKPTTGGGVFKPSNSLAIALRKEYIREDSYVDFVPDSKQLGRYLKGETVTTEDRASEDKIKNSGYVVIGTDKYPTGFGKINGHSIKNMYPAAWRNV